MDPHADVQAQEVRSSVKVEQNSRGFAQVKVSVYAGETTESMQEIIDVAVAAYNTTIRALGASVQTFGKATPS